MSDSSASGNKIATGRWRFVAPDAIILLFDFSSLFIWLYAVTKAFFFDIDSLFESLFPASFHWISSASFIWVIIWLGLSAILLRKAVLIYIVYIVAFPIILFIWKIPAILWAIGNWTFGISVLNAFLSLFTDISRRLIFLLIYTVAFVAIISSNDGVTLLLAAAILIITLISSYVFSAIRSINTPKVLSLYKSFFRLLLARTGSELTESRYGPPGTKLSEMPENAVGNYRSNVMTLLLISRSSYFLADKMKNYQGSAAGSIFGIISMSILLFWNFAIFSISYYALYKMDPGQFSLGFGNFSAGDVFSFSFSNMIFGSITDAHATGAIALIFSIIQRILSILVIGIFFAILFSFRTKKYEDEVGNVIDTMSELAKRHETAVSKYYGYLNADEIIDDLIQADTAFSKFILRLSNSIRKYD